MPPCRQISTLQSQRPAPSLVVTFPAFSFLLAFGLSRLTFLLTPCLSCLRVSYASKGSEAHLRTRVSPEGVRDREEEEAVDVVISGMVLDMHKEELKATEREDKPIFLPVYLSTSGRVESEASLSRPPLVLSSHSSL